ncbi:hypothetical protein J6590_013643 [Homalodisca vitripennis]|nr:hypothetical protein J6590_013643 [Homalodisca vitripennis]
MSTLNRRTDVQANFDVSYHTLIRTSEVIHSIAALYCQFRCELVWGRVVHRYDTRGENSYRKKHHSTLALNNFLHKLISD